jgi:ABC-type transport system involved in multi-copper enzyme maturation permease subunit
MNDSISSPTLDYTSEPTEPPGGVWTQTMALLYDAYLDLQSRRLFWLTLLLSLVASGIFGFVGINPEGITIFGRQIRGIPFNSVLIPPADFFKYLFTNWAIPIWLGFFATVLALIAVGGLFPDAISSGSIDLYLSRPIGRLRLFLVKYVFGLLFTALQVSIFCLTSFLVIGFRGGAWEFGIFLAIPLVALFFSYLYCVCVLIGILTRSTLSAILLTGLFWGLLFVVHLADMALSGGTSIAADRVDRQSRLISMNEAVLAQNNAQPPDRRSNMSGFEFQLNAQRETLLAREQEFHNLLWWKELVLSIETPLPKTNETIALMSRYLVRPGALDAVDQRRAEIEAERRRQWEARRRSDAPTSRPTTASAFRIPFFSSPATAPATAPALIVDQSPQRRDEFDQAVAQELGARDLPWVIGTSLGFEVVVLGMAAWVFCRRDF